MWLQLTNFRSESQDALPRPTSIEAILDSPRSVASADTTVEDPRLATARKWTTVTSNTDLLNSILSSWTTHEYSYYHYLDREAFLDDMASSRTDYCSELLVNALLATACVGTTSFICSQKPLPPMLKSAHSIVVHIFNGQ